MNFKSIYKFFLLGLVVFATGCNKSESYSNLLKDETKAVNWFLAGQQVSVELPSDPKDLIVGKDAPYYKIREDGTVYMQVINQGDVDENTRPKTDDKVYFRYSRKNLKLMWQGTDVAWEGNSQDVTGAISPTYFVYGNTYLPSTTMFGSGLQLPLQYVGYDSEVNLVIKATAGFADAQSTAIPYLYNVRYFKALY